MNIKCIYCKAKLVIEEPETWATANKAKYNNYCICPLQTYTIFNDVIIYYKIILDNDISFLKQIKNLQIDEELLFEMADCSNTVITASREDKFTYLDYRYSMEEYIYQDLSSMSKSIRHPKYIEIPDSPSIQDFINIAARLEKLQSFK